MPRPEIEKQFTAYRKRLRDGGEILWRRSDESGLDKEPFVTVITPAFNSIKTIEQALASVRQQTYPHIEHIVVDGGSTDGTVALLLKVKETLAQIISGPDANPADALNKGLAVCHGEFISVLPSDDMFPPDYVANAMAAILREKCDFVFGDLIYTVEGQTPLLVPGDPNYVSSIRHKMPVVNSTSMLMRRTSFETIGLFDMRIRYSPDYDWVLRAHLAGLRGAYDPAIRTYFAHGGMSTVNYFAALAAVRDVAITHGCPPLKAYMAFIRGVLQKVARTALRKVLPDGVFHAVLKYLTRTGTAPLR